LSRRQFLARAGVLGAAVTLARLPGSDWTAQAADIPGLDQFAALLRELARDTFSGLIAFVVPGPDPYSVAQGVSTPAPGGIDAKGVDFIMYAADHFAPFPDEYFRPLVRSMATGAEGTPLQLPAPLQAASDDTAAQLDDAFKAMFENNQAIPLSSLFALTLNFLATTVNPASAHGQFLSPFARLSFDEKASAFEMFEKPDPDMVAMIDANLSEPLHESVSGLMRFAAGALLEFAAFGSYSEFGVFDAATRTVSKRAVGWDLSKYQPGVDGWDELKGYYQGRKRVTG
jgi:hypothetical protein